MVYGIILSGGHMTDGGHPGCWEPERQGTLRSWLLLWLLMSDFMDNLTLVMTRTSLMAIPVLLFPFSSVEFCSLGVSLDCGFGIWKHSKTGMFNTIETFPKGNNGTIHLPKAISRLVACQHRSSGNNCGLQCRAASDLWGLPGDWISGNDW